MKRIIKLNNKSLLIECNIEEYSETILNRIDMFDEDNTYKYYIVINEDKTIYNLDEEIVINGRLAHTDLYQLINNIISNLINDDNNLYIHSCVITSDNNTIIILGDFNAGKTTVALEAVKHGYKIVSADQSWLRFDDTLKLYKGSTYLVYDDKKEMIDKINEEISIDKIYFLSSIYNGELKLFNNDNKLRFIKQMCKYTSWSILNSLMTDDIELNLNRITINNFIKKIDIPSYSISGSTCDIIKKMEE